MYVYAYYYAYYRVCDIKNWRLLIYIIKLGNKFYMVK